jgi:CubicO group peptidase (beta-lactamase class C family)
MGGNAARSWTRVRARADSLGAIMIGHRMRVRSFTIAAGWLALVLLSAATEATPPCGVPSGAGDGWATATAEDANLDPEKLCALDRKLDQPDLNVHGVVVVRGGKLVYEAYRAGEDYQLATNLGVVSYDASMQHDVRSVTKSVTSLLFGVALDRKLISSIDKPVFDFFPEHAALRTPEKERIQLRHLLTMTAGFDWNEKLPYTDRRNSEIQMIFAEDPYRFVLEQQVVAEPGKTWNYSGGSTQLLAGVIQKATGRALADFAKDELFTPLGIKDFEWIKLPGGDAAAASGLRLRPRDMAKIGQMVLSKGTWNGRQLVSEQWRAEAIRGRYDGWGSNRYGYQWWSGESSGIAWIAGWGLGGQRIFIMPDRDLVVVTTAGLYQSNKQDEVVRGILDDVLAAIVP